MTKYELRNKIMRIYDSLSDDKESTLKSIAVIGEDSNAFKVGYMSSGIKTAKELIETLLKIIANEGIENDL